MADPARLADVAVRQRLADLDELLARVETVPGPAGELAMRAVSALAQVYGEALARAVSHASAAPAALEAMLGDELLGHLLVLHGVHPEPVERRVARALGELRPALEGHGAAVSLVELDSGVATVEVAASGCGASSVGELVREAVLAIAPELTDVRLRPAQRSATFVPVEQLLRPPAGSGAGR